MKFGTFFKHKDGNLKNWWTEEDSERFNERNE